MKLLKRIFKKKPLAGWPKEGKEREVHIKCRERTETGSTLHYLHFPGFEQDYFAIEDIRNEFDKSRTIKPYVVHSVYGERVMSWSSSVSLDIGLMIVDGLHFLSLSAYQKELKFRIGDRFACLLENQKICDMEIDSDGQRAYKDSEGVVTAVLIEVAPSLTNQLSEHRMLKWRYSSNLVGTISECVVDSREQRNIQEMAKMIREGDKLLKR